ncbi:aspartyl-tRNA(Asn)/glutamyl-tRNA(Gln) amidotransferase subunit A [Pantoea sp. AN62]|nr:MULTISPECIES: amidase [Pantoea]MCQ5471487.1 amidase [Pantoea brenneri]MDU4747962.1 amidase [Pantoea sp.]
MKMQNELFFNDATELAQLIRNGDVSPVEVVKAHLDRIEQTNPQVNAIVTLAENALSEAKAAEQAVRSGQPLGPLHGVPFTVKDSIDTAGVMTQRGSPIFRHRMPSQDATSVARMKAAGGILLAKSNLPEFSYWIESDNLLSGRTNNPWDLTRTPGGSSGGESAAIAAGMSPLGLGTDLAISVRGPASQTGITSIKATHGSIPMTGIWPRAPRRFWHVGPMARSVRDIALAFSLLSGPDGQDAFATRAAHPLSDHSVQPRPLRIGWMTGPGFGPVDAEVAAVVKAAAAALQQSGVQVEEVGIAALERDFALDVFNRLHVMEMKPAFAAAVAGRDPAEIYKMARTMLSLPDTPLQAYIEAEQAAERIRDGYADYFSRYDALITQVLPTPAHKHGIEQLVIDGQTVDVSWLQAATVPLNVTGLPGIALPFGQSSEGLPINIQITGKWHDEATILAIAARLEALSPVAGLHPRQLTAE